jgi:Holliday junction resolvase YEN1
LSPNDLAEFLNDWRNTLRNILRHDSDGSMGSIHMALSNNISDDFPDLHVLRMYARPIVTHFNSHWDTPGWQPQQASLEKLVAFCKRSFSWGNKTRVLSYFEKHIWPGIAIRYLANVCVCLLF